MYFFVAFVRPYMRHNYGGISGSHAYMRHNYGGISGSHAYKDCVWPIILHAELYTTCHGELVLVIMTHQVHCNIPTFEAVIRKKYELVSRKMQKVY